MASLYDLERRLKIAEYLKRMVKINASMARYSSVSKPETGSTYRTKVIDVNPEDTFDFECQKCGFCCTWPPRINPNEMTKLAEYTEMSKPDFFSKYTEMEKHPVYGLKVKLLRKNGHCVFFGKKDGKRSCSVYPARPRECHGLPLIVRDDVPDYSDAERCFRINVCQGLDRGPEHTVSEWIKENGLVKTLAEEIEYLREISYLAGFMKPSELEGRVRDFFLRQL